MTVRPSFLRSLVPPLSDGPGPSDTIDNHVESYVSYKSLKTSIGVEIFRWDG
jgi:hypothetical protein